MSSVAIYDHVPGGGDDGDGTTFVDLDDFDSALAAFRARNDLPLAPRRRNLRDGSPFASGIRIVAAGAVPSTSVSKSTPRKPRVSLRVPPPSASRATQPSSRIAFATRRRRSQRAEGSVRERRRHRRLHPAHPSNAAYTPCTFASRNGTSPVKSSCATTPKPHQSVSHPCPGPSGPRAISGEMYAAAPVRLRHLALRPGTARARRNRRGRRGLD